MAAQVFAPQVKGEEVTIKGEIVDLWCFMQAEHRGQGHKTCSTKCANQGNPIGFVDAEKGEAYVLAGRTDYQVTHEVRDNLVKRMNEAVTLGGTVVKKGTMQVLYVKTLDGQPADAKP